ncbi:MAG: hypothetical protein ACRCV5_14035 [Afipia sp.]
MKNKLSYSTRRFVLVAGAFCAYGLLVGGLIVLNASNPHAKGEATFDTATMDFPSSNAAPAAKAAIAALPIQELHRKAANLPVEVFTDPN